MDSKALKKLGIKIGHYTDAKNLKGTTIFIAEKGAEIGIDIRGSDTGSFNTHVYGPKGTSDTVNGIVLTGGSTFGLESVFGLMKYLEENKIGAFTRAAIIPNITGAAIYDLGVGNSKKRPGKMEGYAAAKNASYSNLAQGNVGVGTGATTGKWFKGKPLKGGFGMSVTSLPNGIIVAAFVVTNSVGDVVNPDTKKFYCDDGNFDLEKKNISEDIEKLYKLKKLRGKNTTLAVVATNVAMDRIQLMKVAELAHDGMARAIFPVHTMFDGDIVFALSSLSGERKTFPKTWKIALTDVVGLGAQEALMKAIKNSIIHAKTIDKFPSYK